jgi:AcrR family transcriptional regulator
VSSASRPPTGARQRILAAAVRRIASEGIDGVRIARIAMDAGVSTALVHYHFDSRDALLAEALDYSYAHADDSRTAGGDLQAARSHAERLQAMLDQCLPSTPELRDDWVLWVELWLHAVRHDELRPFAAELYARMRAWFASEIAAGVRDGEFERCDPEDVADRTLALIDGFGVRTLVGDPMVPLERARMAVSSSLARDLGLGERLTKADPVTGTRAVQTAARAGAVKTAAGAGRGRSH